MEELKKKERMKDWEGNDEKKLKEPYISIKQIHY
jgi:hypothetical protein